MADHSPLPWFVHETKHPHHLGGVHTERRIFTVSIHPQLKDHDGVVNGSVGIGPIEGGPPIHMVSISAVDAAFIVKAVNNHDALVKALQLARNRIHYLGVACSNPKHYEANQETFLPAIDEVLNADVGGEKL